MLVSSDESRNTMELDDMYVVLPAHPWFLKPEWSEGRPLLEDFEFTSDGNDHWLSAEELSEMSAQQ